MAIIEKKRSTSLRKIFMQFILVTGISVVFIICIYAVLMVFFFQCGLILPANTYANMVSAYEKQIEAGQPIAFEAVPKEIGYAVYDSSGQLEETNLSGKEEQKIIEQIKDQKEKTYSNGQEQYMVIKTGEKTYIFQYYITAEFSSPFLRKLFPHMEWTVIAAGVCIILADLVLVCLLYAKRLKKKVAFMKEAADQIKEKNLEFTMKYTGIGEFDDVMSSLEQLKISLSQSLSEQWSMQQQKKEQMRALAHDIKTPLTVIRGNTELLAETELDEEQKSYLAFIEKNIEKMQQYLTELIEISKGRITSINKQPVEAEEFFMRLEQEAAPMLQFKSLEIHTENRLSGRILNLDMALCIRAVLNLLDNAVQYTPKGSTIYLTGWQEEDDICIEVRDEGQGFSAEDLKYAAKEFYRASQNRNASEHFGMGLYIAEQIARLHGGGLHLANVSGGAQVIFTVKNHSSQ